jgi:hypothetical protein
VVSLESDRALGKMSGALGSDDFYQNLLQYMNQNTQYETVNSLPLSFAPHEAEKHGRDEVMTDENDNKRRGAFDISVRLESNLVFRVCSISRHGIRVRGSRRQAEEEARS